MPVVVAPADIVSKHLVPEGAEQPLFDTVHIGGALNKDDDHVTAHDPPEIFPTATDESLVRTTKDAESQLTVALRILSPFVFDVLTLFARIACCWELTGRTMK